MNRIGSLACAVFLCFGCSTGLHDAIAQGSPKTLKDQLTGSWRLVSINNLRLNGTKYELFGPNAKGIVIFDRNGSPHVRHSSPKVVWKELRKRTRQRSRE